MNFWPEVFTNPVVTGVGALVEEELVEEELVELGVEDVDLTVVDTLRSRVQTGAMPFFSL